MASKKPGKYIGDAGVAKVLESYGSTVPFHIVRLRVAGALASPNKELLPVMVVASFWPEDQFPRFTTKVEAENFFSTFMGLWRRMEKIAAARQNLLSAPGKLKSLEDAKELLIRRIEELEAGFIEGFWGGQDDMKMASATAALIDGMGEQADFYSSLLQDISDWTEFTDVIRDALNDEIQEHDAICEDAIKALLILKSKNEETTH